MSRLGLIVACLIPLTLCGTSCTENKGGTAAPAGPSLIEQYNAAKQLTDPEKRADGLIAVGLKQLDAQDSGGADLSFKEATRSIEDIQGSPTAQARLFLVLADGYQRAKNKSKASAAIDGAAEAIVSDANTDPPVTKANQLASLASLRAAAGNPESALEDAKRAEKLIDKVELPLDKVDVLAAVMRSYATLKNQAELDRVVASANKLAAAQERPRDNALILLKLSTAQSSLGQADAAKATLEKAAGLARGISGNPLQQAHALYEAAETASAIGQKALCSQLLSEADAAAKKSPEGGEIISRIDALRRKLGL